MAAATRSPISMHRPHCSSFSSAATARSCATSAPGSPRWHASTSRAGSPWSRSTRTTSRPIRRTGRTACVAEAAELGYVFPYLLDATQSVAKAYRAACTPDFFLFDADRRLVYRGQFDDSRPGNGRPVTGADLRAAIDATLAGHAPGADQLPSLGCNIKWRKGNEPDYARG